MPPSDSRLAAVTALWTAPGGSAGCLRRRLCSPHLANGGGNGPVALTPCVVVDAPMAKMAKTNGGGMALITVTAETTGKLTSTARLTRNRGPVRLGMACRWDGSDPEHKITRTNESGFEPQA